MTTFLLIFLSIYSAMHAVVFFRTRVLLPAKGYAQWFLVIFMLFMIITPITARILEKNGYDKPAQILAFIGFSWLGFMLLSFLGGLAMNVVDLISWGLNRIVDFHAPLLSGKIPALCLVGLTVVLCGYGFFEAKKSKIERLHIETDKLPTGANPFIIVQISDVHLGLTARSRFIKSLVDRINGLHPDILVCTGDLIDGKVDHLPDMSDLLNQIHARYGKYAVTGNHEYYVGLDDSLKFFRKSGFTVLRGESRKIDSFITIVGVDYFSEDKTQSDARMLSKVNNDTFTLFLKHRPDVEKEALGLFDLQLSGHTHGGQIFPFNLLVSRRFPFIRGYYHLQNGSKLYTSRGTGTWGPQMRILSPPEITVIKLTSKQNRSTGS